MRAIFEPGVIEELRNVVATYPVWPGNTLSHRTAKICNEFGWIVRNTDGDWIPTRAGIRALEVAQ